MAHIHSLGVLHRDLKPENILLSGEGEAARVKIGDFGWAARECRSVGRALAGTYVYMAPEVLDGRTHSKK